MAKDLITSFTTEYTEYLRDESRRSGTAASLSFPLSEAEVVAVIKAMAKTRTAVTVQGGRTGIAAAAVPGGGHILNLSRMKAITGLRQDGATGRFILFAQPGILLSQLRSAIDGLNFSTVDWETDSIACLASLTQAEPVFFPPDPTETSASLGGMVACNASGAMSYFYGPTRDHIETLRIVLAGGEVVSLARGACLAEARTLKLTCESGRMIELDLPKYLVPEVKSAAGYYAADGMDAVDLFIGMEGTLGVITEIGIRLSAKPEGRIALCLFPPSEAITLQLVRALRGENPELSAVPKPVAIEFFNARTLDLLRQARAQRTAFGTLPEIKSEYQTALYVEFHGGNQAALEDSVLPLADLLTELGCRDDMTWYADSRRTISLLKEFRHTPPEAVNLAIDEYRRCCPGLTKLGTDMSVRDVDLEWVLDLYNRDLVEAGLDYVIFGHIGNNHVHVNIIPKDMEEYAAGKALYLAWAEQVVARGGSVSGEHGIGKLKVDFLTLMMGEDNIAAMRRVKELLDPDALLGLGTLFSAE